MAAAYEIVARRHNATALTGPVDPAARPYRGRPYRVIMADRFADACHSVVADADPGLAGRPRVGSVDQFADSTDALRDPATARRLGSLYHPPA